MAIESMYVFTGDEVVATDLPAKLNENFAKTETNMLKTVNNVAQDENHNINVTELIPKQITSNTNLNNVVTSGEYTFTKGSANITNSPTTNSFFLTVLRNDALVKQVVTDVVLDDPITYTRVLSGSSWSPWVEGGKVKTINSINPDDSGNVFLNLVESLEKNTEDKLIVHNADGTTQELELGKNYDNDLNNILDNITELETRVVPIEKGGTGATTVAEARKNLGLESTTEVIPISQGGTGANNASDACANIGALPTNGGNITGSLSIGGYVVVPCYSNAAAHNAIYRGKYLGASVTDEQWAAIKAGTFEGLYIGDHWTINGVDYVIAAFDYYLNAGHSPVVTAHHVTLVPRKNLYNHVMNNTDDVTGAYVGSKMYASGLNTAKTTIANAFGSAHVLTIRQYFPNSVKDSYEDYGSWYDTSVYLMNEINVYGGYVFKNFVHGTNWAHMYSIDNSQYPVFAFDKTMIHTRQDYWLRDVATSSRFSSVYGDGGLCYYDRADLSLGVRPAFNIYQS